jgi:hypothetical protein
LTVGAPHFNPLEERERLKEEEKSVEFTDKRENALIANALIANALHKIWLCLVFGLYKNPLVPNR